MLSSSVSIVKNFSKIAFACSLNYKKKYKNILRSPATELIPKKYSIFFNISIFPVNNF